MSNEPTLYMMLGFPGAGKTTVAEMIAKITGAVHLNSDQIRLHMFDGKPKFTLEEHNFLYNTLDYFTELILDSGKSVIYDANLNQYSYRKEKYDIAAKTDAQAQLIWVKTDEALARQRATLEADNNPAHRPFGNMNTAVFERLAAGLEEPRKNENAIIIDGAKDINIEKIKKALDEKS